MNDENLKFNRILASLIDGLFMFIITVGLCIAPAITFINNMLDDRFIVGDMIWLILSFTASVLIWILYLTLPSLFIKKGTIGMKICHLSFESSKEKELRYYQIFFREFAVVFSIIFSFGLTLVSDLVSTILSKEGKTYFDVLFFIKVVSNSGVE